MPRRAASPLVRTHILPICSVLQGHCSTLECASVPSPGRARLQLDVRDESGTELALGFETDRPPLTFWRTSGRRVAPSGITTFGLLCRRAVLPMRAVAALVLVGASSVLGWWLGDQRHDASPHARVIDVIDGDTIVVAFADGSTDTIRLLGVDTPKVAQHHLRRGKSPRGRFTGRCGRWQPMHGGGGTLATATRGGEPHMLQPLRLGVFVSMLGPCDGRSGGGSRSSGAGSVRRCPSGSGR